jgi:hypothetical protein
VEAQVTERHVNPQVHVASGILNLLGEGQKLLVQLSSPATLLLFGFKLFFVAEAMLALAVASLIKLHVGRLAEELDILGLSLANHDWIDQMQVNDDDEFLLAGLEEKMAHVVEEHVHLGSSGIIAHAMYISDTILVDFHVSRNSLAVHCWAEEDHVELLRAAV